MTSMPKTSKQIRIALVTDDPYRVESLDEIVTESGWSLFMAKGQPETWLTEEAPNLIVVDLDVPRAVALLADLSINAPGVPLLALATPQQLAELQDALLAGAKAFVPFPVTGPQFVAAVARLMHGNEPAQGVVPPQPADAPPPMPQQVSQKRRIIAVTGLKGGVGRSTVAVNLAAALQQSGKSDVILVESHGGLSDLSLMLNLHPTRTLAHLDEETEIDLDIVQGNLCQHESGLRLLAAPTKLENLVELPPESWPHLLSLLTEIAGTVVVDTGVAANAILSEILTTADEIVVVTGADTVSLNSTWPLLQTLRQGHDVHGQIHLVLNRVGMPGAVSKSTVSKHLQQRVDIELLDDAPLVTYSVNRGIPFVFSQPRALLSRRFVELVDHLNGRQPKTNAVTEDRGSSAGLFSTLRNRAAAFASFF